MERGFYVKAANGTQCPPPQPAPAAFARLNYIRNQVCKRVAIRPPMPLESTVNLWTGRQRKIYEKALEDVKRLEWYHKWAHVKTFVKREKYNLKSKPDPVPRMIQPRDPCYNLLLASHLKHNEKAYYKALDDYTNSLTGLTTSSLACGVDVWELGSMFSERWNSLKSPVAFCIDAKRWDQHCSRDALRFEHGFYTCKNNSAQLRFLLKQQLTNRGRTVVRNGKEVEGFISYTLKGCRMSGDMNTALGNKLLMCSISMDLFLSLGLPPIYVNNGDDMILFCESWEAERLKNALAPHYLTFGYQVEVEKYATELEHITFCQMNPIRTPDGIVMCRDPFVVLSKDHHCLQPGLDYRTWLNSVGDAGRRLSSGLPVLETFYNTIITGDKRYQSLKPFYFAPKSYTQREVDTKTRISFAIAFGIFPSEQITIERWLAKNLPELNKRPLAEGVTHTLY